MSFLAPAAFALAALIPVIIAMYLLKLRRTEQVVSGVYLWRRMVRDLEANAPWQRLRRNLLLLVQLLCLAALILALARPFTWAEGIGGQAAILIFDVSASMAATDVAPTRLAAAKAQAQQLVEGLAEDVRVTVIAAGEGAQVLAASSQDRRQVRLAIDGIRPGIGASDLTAALELASAIAARQPDTEVVVFSDGRVKLPQRLAFQGHLRYSPMGISGENQAIGILSLQPSAGGSSLTAFVQVVNYGQSTAQRRLALYADGELVDAYDLELAPRGQRAVVADDLPPDTRVLQAQLLDRDVLPADDTAWAVQRRGGPVAVTLVSGGNLFLETALSLFPNLEVTTVQPEDWEKRSAGEQNSGSEGEQDLSDLTILDAYVPLTATLPAGALLFIAPPRSTEVFSVTGSVSGPVPRAISPAGDGAQAVDPLLSHVNVGGVSVLETARIPLPGWARLLIAGDTAEGTTPLLFAGEADGRRVAVLSFDLHRSDLPLQVAFPLLLANLVGWLAPGSGGDLPTQVAPGAALTFALPPEVDALRITRPDGSVARLLVEGGQAVWAETTQLGVYVAEWGEGQQVAFAVNLFSAQESDVQPAGTLPLSGQEAAGQGDEEVAQRSRREWWRALAWAALALMVVEWLVYQRATLARLWGVVARRWARAAGQIVKREP